MLFLLNNPIIAFIILVVIGLMVLTISKIVNEVKLNKNLQIRQQMMRIKRTKNPFRKRMSLLGAQALIPVSIVIIAFVVGANLQTTPSMEFNKVSSSDDVISLFQDFQDKMNSNYSYGIFRESMTDGALETALDAIEDNNTAGAGSDDYSQTNNQVLGVQEMDNVLTDGKYIYALYGSELTITLAYTEVNGIDVLDLVKTITYNTDYCEGDGFYPVGLYIDENQLIVVGNKYSYQCSSLGDDYDYYYEEAYYYNESSHVKVLVYDKEDFQLQDEYEFNGYFTGTRKIDNTLYLIVNNYIPFYQEDINVDYYLPYYEVNGAKTSAQYEDIYYVEGTNPNTFTTFLAIDLNLGEVDMEVVLGNNGFNLYVSEHNMYLVGGVYYFWPLAEIVDVEDPVQEYRTAIMRVSITGADIEFSGVGYVEGYTLNQFSMDEYDGNLRITTTEGWWGESINNRLYVLDGDMNVLSELENLGKPGETIRSTRFVGEYAYLVTFEQTDPFYVINLSDPENPIVEGELEIPGFSTYLQPLSDDLMLGIGFHADNTGRVQGLKISIYDISDKENPVIFDEIIFDYEDFGWSYSTATYNHKDLLVSVKKGIIALPFSSYNWDETNGNSYNSGILVYNLDLETGLSLNGFVQHEMDSDWDVYVYKAKFIDRYFYTISNKYIKVSEINDVEMILDTVQLRDVEANYYYGTEVD